MGGVILGGILALALVIYFLPAIVADKRKHPSAGGIMVLNLLLGWTCSGGLSH